MVVPMLVRAIVAVVVVRGSGVMVPDRHADRAGRGGEPLQRHGKRERHCDQQS